MPPRTVRLLVTLLILAAPTAAAASPVDAQLDAPVWAWDGEARLQGSQGALDLAPSGASLRLAWSDASGYLRERVVREDRVPGIGVTAEGDNRSVTYGAGRIDGIECFDDCVALLFVDGTGSVGAEGAADAELARASSERVFFAGHPPALGSPQRGERDSGIYYKVPSGWHVLESQDGLHATASGEARLVLKNAVARVVLDDGTSERIDTRRHRSGTDDPASHALGESVQPYLVLGVRDARLDATPGAFALYAPVLEGAIEGALRATASGRLSVDAHEHRLSDTTLALEGRFTSTFAQESAAGGTGLALSGEADRVVIAGVTYVDAERAARATAVAGGVTALALALAVLYYLKGALLAPLYSRIERSDVLDNDNRRRIHELVHGSHGLTVADIARRTGLSRVVVKHHLQVLEAHRFLARAHAGAARLYVVPGTQPQPPGERPDEVLRAPLRREVAQALRGAPLGLTQRELVERTGASQRLVSYHLQKLEACGLVTASGGLPRRYQATARLDEAGTQDAREPVVG